ncbi:chemotaxis protein CheW [Halosimplex aquaticum]|uniref:Chemotaxis protein CheW n=1 Tax=Halosimplex aquaticum TaxID=3026162 RepID=A0ABD5XV80_9EURY|nr:chemotaxis protein CheW [Halosimplex aquaticum]
MTDDDERMDRARRIREMREGSRPQDDASNDDQPADSSADGAEADDADEPDADASADPAPDGGDADREAASEEDQPTDDADSAEDDGETRADDPADSTDDEPADAEADDVSADADDESADGEAVDDAEEVDDAESAAAAAAEAAAELSETDEGGTIHIPGADVGDVEVDVEEMARQAGLSSADGPDGDAGGEEDDGGVDPVAPGAAGRAEGAETQTGEETRVLEFALGDEQYCLDIEYVEEIVKRETVTRVPNTADCVEGVVDLRGQITTILDPKVLLDIPEEGSKDLIVVFDPDEFDDQGAVGWVVDDVNQVTPITEDEVNPSPVDQDHVNGVVDRDGEFVIWTTPELDLDEATG